MEDAATQVEAETEEKINFHSPGHLGMVLSSLEEQRKKNFLCDITLMVENVEFRAHKALLAASSEYFSVMFADEESIGQSVYVIEGIVSEVFESLLQFIYTGNVHVGGKNLKQVVSTAHVLKIDDLVKAYIEYQQELLKPPADVSDNKTDEADEPVSKRKRGRPKKLTDLVTDQPVTDQPVTDQTVTDQPVTDQPVTDQAVTDQAVTDQAVTDQAVTDQAVTDQAVTDQTDTDQADTDQADTDQADTDQADTDQAVTDQAVTDQAVTDQAVTDQAVTDQTVTDQTVTDQTVTEADSEEAEESTEHDYIPESIEETCYSNGDMLHDHEVADFAAEVTCDLNPKPQEEQIILTTPTKRRTRRTIKVQDNKSGEDNEDCEPTKNSVSKKILPPSEATCKDCGKVFKYKHFLVMHQRTHTGECPFKCAQCGKGFAQKHSLRVHERIHTGERPYSCTVCSKSLSTKTSLKEHMRLHAEEKAYICDKCGKFFNQKRQLQSHYRIHIGEGLRNCEICQRTFVDSSHLKKHLRSHTGEKPYTCEICGKSFTAKSSLLTHARIHRGEKPYSCNICGKAFSDSSAKRRHIILHTGDKPFSCTDCSIKFSRLDNLKAHVKTHGKIRKTRIFPCYANISKMEQKNLLQMAQHQLAAQEIQYLVTDNVHNLNFLPGQGIVTAEAAPANANQAANIAVISHQPPVLHGLQVASHQRHVQPGHNIDLVEGRVHSVLPEQVHVVTLSKEAFDQLQRRTHGIQLAPTNHPVTQVPSRPPPTLWKQGIRVPPPAPQTVAVTAITQHVPANPTPAPSLQAQSGAVPVSNTTGTPNSTSV